MWSARDGTVLILERTSARATARGSTAPLRPLLVVTRPFHCTADLCQHHNQKNDLRPSLYLSGNKQIRDLSLSPADAFSTSTSSFDFDFRKPAFDLQLSAVPPFRPVRPSPVLYFPDRQRPNSTRHYRSNLLFLLFNVPVPPRSVFLQPPCLTPPITVDNPSHPRNTLVLDTGELSQYMLFSLLCYPHTVLSDSETARLAWLVLWPVTCQVPSINPWSLPECCQLRGTVYH